MSEIAQRRETLDELSVRFGTDKGPRAFGKLAAKCYTRLYEELFANFRDSPVRLLEIGIGGGGSIRMWREYFPKAAVFAIDVNPTCATVADDRTQVFIGDQADAEFLKSVVSHIDGPLDIVVDDGGHLMEQRRASFEAFYPLLSLRGIYIVEDLHADHNRTCRWISTLIPQVRTRTIGEIRIYERLLVVFKSPTV